MSVQKRTLFDFRERREDAVAVRWNIEWQEVRDPDPNRSARKLEQGSSDAASQPRVSLSSNDPRMST